MSRPSKTMVPAPGSTEPLIALRRVDLPAPFVPRRATISPSRTSKSTPKRTWVLPYDTSTPRATSILGSPFSREARTSDWVADAAHTREMSLRMKRPAVAMITAPIA